MSDTHNPPNQRQGWFAFPLLIFAASRVLLFAFAESAPLFGPAMGTDGGLARGGLAGQPWLAALGHGDIASYARIARAGYTGAADVAWYPLVPLLGKLLGKAMGSVEMALIVLSLVGCAAGFIGLYRLFQVLRDRDTARWGVALLAAFPFAYHLSDGSALACLLALSTWGMVLAVRGSFAWAGVMLSLAVLAHPIAIFSALAALSLPAAGLSPAKAWPRPWTRWLVAILPVVMLVGWPLYLRSHLGMTTASLWGALWPKAAPTGFAWSAMLVGFGGLTGVGVLLLLRLRGLRVLALAGGVQLAFALQAWSPSAAISLTLCWPAFLGLAALLARRQALRAPLVAMLGAHQGLLLYCFTHFLRLT